MPARAAEQRLKSFWSNKRPRTPGELRPGYIHTGRHWLKASAPGRGSVLIPLDGQGYPRDIDDRRPLFVTVPLRKQGVTETAATKPVP